MISIVLMASLWLCPQTGQTSTPIGPTSLMSSDDVREPVAELLLEVTSAEPFILRGTIPLPPGTYLPGSPSPLVVEDSDGRLINDTQVEVVSRYPDPSDGADVVEVIARVKPVWTGKPSHYYQRFNVFHLERQAPQPPATPNVLDLVDGPKNVPERIQSLLVDPDSILVVATDPLGNQYVARPLRALQGTRAHRYGPYMTTVRTYETLRPDDPSSLPPNAYRHMMGVHSYLSTMTGEDALLLDLRFNNGSDGFNTVLGLDDPLGKIYFERLDLYVERSATKWWARQQFRDPSAFDPFVDQPTKVVYDGRNYYCFPIVKPMPGASGPMHLMPCKSQFLRRMVISPVGRKLRAFGILNQEGLAYAIKWPGSNRPKHWSWWNEDTARYFPQRYPLASIDWTNGSYGGKPHLRRTLTRWFEGCRDALANSTPFPLPEDKGSYTQLGWARPLGVPDGGATGGLGIQFVDGDRTVGCASTDGYRYLQLRHRLHGDRMPNVVWDQHGDPTGQDKWLVKCPSCDPVVFPVGPSGKPSWTFVVHDMNQGIYDPDFCPTSTGWAQNVHVSVNGLRPGYETNPDNFYNLTAYYPHNTYHHIRYTRLPMALSWIANDPVARDDVRAQAEMFRLTYTEYTNTNGAAYAASMAYDRKAVLARPGWGYHTGRGEGWGSTCMAAAYAMADDGWRASMRTWFDRVVATMDRGMSNTQTPGYGSIATGLPYDWGSLIGLQSNKLYGVQPADPRARQTWEEMIVQSAQRAFSESVFTEADPELAVLADIRSRSYYGLISPVSWNENGMHIWETCPVSDSTSTSPVTVYNCDPTTANCAGANPLPGGSYAPKWKDNHYTWPAMADGFDLTGDMIFRRRAYRMLTGNSCTKGCEPLIENALMNVGNPTWEPDYSEWSNKSVLLGRVQ